MSKPKTSRKRVDGVVILFLQAGLGVEDIAVMTGIPVDACRRVVAKLRETGRLRDALFPKEAVR